MISNTRDIQVEFGHCDPSGIVFNPNYFIWFDFSVHALLGKAGLDLMALRRDFGGDGIPVVETKARFAAPSRWGDQLRIESRVSRLGKSSFDLEHRAFNGEVLAVECVETRVWTVLGEDGAIRSAPIPRAVVERMSRA